MKLTVYGWGQDGYHEIEYTCKELDSCRDTSFDFLPGNSSDARVSVQNGIVTAVWIHYVE